MELYQKNILIVGLGVSGMSAARFAKNKGGIVTVTDMAKEDTLMMRFAKRRGVPTDVPWRELSEKDRRWVIDGEGSSREGKWYGVDRFFKWLESRAYKMHVRVMLSKYRAYTPCPACHGARLKAEPLLWRLGTKEDAATINAVAPDAPPGLSIHELVSLPIDRARAFFESVHLPAPLDEATDLLLGEIRARFAYLVEVGLGYLTLDRQSRTLSGGEVQRINLTTALGTSLVNTLFVLDEPSIGLHARDIGRVIGVLRRLRERTQQPRDISGTCSKSSVVSSSPRSH